MIESLQLQITDAYINTKLFKQFCMPVDRNCEKTFQKEKEEEETEEDENIGEA